VAGASEHRPFGWCGRVELAEELSLQRAEIAGGVPARARSHCRFVPPLIHSITDLLEYSAPIFLNRQCDRTLGPAHARGGAARGHQGGDHGGNSAAMARLLAACADPNASVQAGPSPSTGEVFHTNLLVVATKHGMLGAVRLLLDAGAVVEALDPATAARPSTAPARATMRTAWKRWCGRAAALASRTSAGRRGGRYIIT
jgi:hypothetical protein